MNRGAKQNNREILLTGIDIGSTTTKIAAVAADTGEIVYSDYRRHNAAQQQFLSQATGQKAARQAPGHGQGILPEKIPIQSCHFATSYGFLLV